ncbi:hypothetical protein [Proteiniphilum saccharofermentans]|uniref:hypothetical protein n=1 Tax=Proteiniphilum saccharofermentans TaxID=1642647 RepID=UPI0028AEFBB8|nr:hypothetical protein [Proteiniphilum saccharofermentans]
MKKVFNAGRVLVITIPLLLLACSKSDDDNGNLPPGSVQLPGHIYHQYTTEVKRVNMQTWEEAVAFSYSAYSTVNWSLSPDGTIRIMSSREPGMYDRNLFTLVSMADESIIKQFEFVPRYGNSTSNYGKLSFDNKLIAVEPDGENGIVIVDYDNDRRYEIDNQDEDFDRGDEVAWLPDNSILFTFRKQAILRSAPPYNQVTMVKEMNYESWGGIRVRPDGQKISLRIGRHVYMMDSNGENLVQVTDSKEAEEIFGEFSPDGKYLLIGADYFHGPASGTSHWYPKIIPADGKKYDMDNDPAVIPLIPKGENSIQKANDVTLWRP